MLPIELTDLTTFGVVGCDCAGVELFEPNMVTATGFCSESFINRSELLLLVAEFDLLNIPDNRPFKSFLLPRMSALAVLTSESEPGIYKMQQLH